MTVLNHHLNGKESSGTLDIEYLKDSKSILSGSSSNQEVISNWLIATLAKRLELDPQTIDTQKDFIDYGLSSLEAVNISGDLEIFLSRRLSPTLLWEHSSIEALSTALAEEGTPDVLVGLADEPIPVEKTEQLLAELDRMPDEDVDALLKSMLSEEESQG